jgi:hypothetical protein
MSLVPPKFDSLHLSWRLTAKATVVTLSSVALVAAATAAAFAKPAPANPPAPTGTIVVNASGSVTVTAQGSWSWANGTAKGDYNSALANCSGYQGVGWNVAWNDPHDAGYLLNYSGHRLDVGSAGNATVGSTADESVHVSSPACGTPGASAETGTWGPISHTYEAGTVPASVCVVTYLLKHTIAARPNEYVVDKNKNNSFHDAVKAGTGASYTTSSACFDPSVLEATPTIVTTSTNATVGSAITDAATLGGTANDQSGGTAGAGGTITFKLYGPTDSGCTSTPIFTSSPVTVSGNGNYGPVSFTPTQGAGSYKWIATYSGDPGNASVTEVCGAAGETSTLSAPTSSTGTTSNASTTTTVKKNPPTSPTSSVPVQATTTAASTAPVAGATTVHTGEPWAGSRPYVVGVIALGLGLMGLGYFERRRTLAVRHADHHTSTTD